MKLRSRNKVDATFNMASMTDIVFLLLIFFILLSTFLTINGLDIDLPKVSANKKWVAVSKLLSRKWPALLPIRDNKVAKRLGYEKSPNEQQFLSEWWKDWHAALTPSNDNQIHKRLTEIREQILKPAKLKVDPSLLRIADVLVWDRCKCKDY